MSNPPRFVLTFINHQGDKQELTINCIITPGLVMCGHSWINGIRLDRTPLVSGIEEADHFIREILEYQINDGSGYLHPDHGTIDTFEMDGVDIEPVKWQYFPPDN